MFGAGLAHTVLAVPIAQERATMHLDTVCTMVDVDKIVMYPNVADTPAGVRRHGADRNGAGDADLVLRVAEAEPFLVAAAKAMSIDTLHLIDTGLDPVTAEREQWDDGNNTLAIAPRLAVAYERNIETNAPARGGRHRGRRDLRVRARLRPRRAAVHVLPDQPRAAARLIVRGPPSSRSSRRSWPRPPRTTTGNGARRSSEHRRRPATPAGRAQPAKSWPWVSAAVATSATRSTAAASASRRSTRPAA